MASSSNKLNFQRIEYSDSSFDVNLLKLTHHPDKGFYEDKSTRLKKYRVTKIQEKLKLTQKFSILNAVDPHSGQFYDLDSIFELNLIDMDTTDFRVPSTGEIIALDDAIERGIVNACLFDEFVEKVNEKYEFVENELNDNSFDDIGQLNREYNIDLDGFIRANLGSQVREDRTSVTHLNNHKLMALNEREEDDEDELVKFRTFNNANLFIKEVSMKKKIMVANFISIY